MKRLLTILTLLFILSTYGCTHTIYFDKKPIDNNTEDTTDKENNSDDSSSSEDNKNDDIIVIPNNEIWYTSTDGNIVEPNKADGFGANLLSNTYENDKGVITFDGEVTSIGEYAFYQCNGLTSITIPNSVTVIGDYIFSFCEGLTNVTIPNSITVIGDAAFANCSGLTSVTIGNGVTKIGNDAFYRSGLTSIAIPNSVIEIGDNAFLECYGLTSITIPNSVIKIGRDPFHNCSNITEFKGKFASEDGRCLIVDGALKSFAPAGITAYNIPNSVTQIGYGAFSSCHSLTSITIPDSVTKIGDYAFEGCYSLTSITIPDSVTEIDCAAFYACDGLTSFIIPNSVTKIDVNPFQHCENLAEFKGKFASEDGRCLIIDGVLNSFAPAGLTTYSIPNNVTEIGSYAFWYCDGLTSITIPDSVTEIEHQAFSYCSGLTSVFCERTTPPTANFGDYWRAFDDNASDRKIYVPRESVNLHKAADGWKEYADAIEPYDF